MEGLKTKEGILAVKLGSQDTESLQLELTLNPALSIIKDSMDEYAKQQSLTFSKWLYDNRWFNMENGKYCYTFEQGTSISQKQYEKEFMKTPQELYEKFLNTLTPKP